jgi:hypothetical protein
MAAQPPAASKDISPDQEVQYHKYLSERLSALTGNRFPQAQDIRDVFVPSGSLRPVRAPVAAVQAAAPAPTGKPMTEAFAESHQLKAVLTSSGGRMAVIDNTCLKIGQKIDGFELLSVGERSATLASDAADKITLRLPEKQQDSQ